MKILKTLVNFRDHDASELMLLDTIEHDGRTWLVPRWVEHPTRDGRMPERVICLDSLPHQVPRLESVSPDYVVTEPLPRSILFGDTEDELDGRFEIVESPDIVDDRRHAPRVF